MAEIKPFQGLRYNSSQIKDLAPVICPPYDVLSMVDQQHCYQKNPYNAIRLEQALIDENQPEDKYTYSSCLLNQWREDGILQLDRQPAFYLHLHHFQHQDKKWKRLGLIARVRLEGKESGVVRPHEGTLAAAKDDRLRLLRACQANISPIFALYNDNGKVSSILSDLVKRQPGAVASTDSGESHKLWTITEPEQIASLQSIFKSLTLYIADGHHRYETALNYRDERRRSLAHFNGEEAFNYVMMTLVKTADPGLLILPVHRLVRGVVPKILSALNKKLKDLFKIEEYTLGTGGPNSSVQQLLDTMKKRGESGIAIGLYGLKPKTFMILHRQEAIPVELMPPHTSPAYRELEVSVLRHLVLEGMLGLGEGDLTYTSQAAEALGRVASGEYQIAFLLNPMGVDKLQAVADAGERLPGKSTYFYPKLPTGLVINLLD